MGRQSMRRVLALARRAQAADLALYRLLTGVRSPTLDRVFASASRVADYSLVWLAIGGVLAALGGERGRRAALGGLVSLGATSALSNGPLKLIWRRARPSLEEGWVLRVRRPRSLSFPSAHTSAAFAFATAAGSEVPALLAPLGALAAAVGYSRIHNRVHYPGDVLAGAALGTAVGLATGRLMAALAPARKAPPQPSPPSPRAGREVVLVTSPHARRAHELGRARAALVAQGFRIRRELTIEHADQLGELIAHAAANPPLVIAAGGDGTIGTVAHHIANTRAVLGILPLGTSNDFARSLGIPMRIEKAARLLSAGKVATVDLGRIDVEGEAPRHFAHAATAGIDVSFAKLATSASVRRRLGRLTYAVAAALALRDRRPFACTIVHEGLSRRLRLTHLSVINAPVFGGFLGLRVAGSNPDDRRLDVLAVEDLPAHRVILAGLYQLFRVGRPLRGIHALHVAELRVHTDRPVEVALDGEVVSRLPAAFHVAGEALRVVTPRGFAGVDDDSGQA